MNSIGASFTTAAAVTTVSLPIPGTRKLLGVLMCIALRANTAVSFATLQTSSSAQRQENSSGEFDLFGYLPVYNDAASAFPGNAQIYIPFPKPITIATQVYMHATVSAGSDCIFSSVFYYE